ncbi:MAG: hypothetical protein Q9222_004642 [Ikaeria aurantiellina]
MPRYGGRSKGCLTCRQRRIKCDEGQPECQKCLRAGRSCPGAATGNVFINLSSNLPLPESTSSTGSAPNLPVSIRTKAASEPAAGTSTSLTPSPSLGRLDESDSPSGSDTSQAATQHPAVSHSTDAAVIAMSIREIDEMTLPPWYQPSKADIFQQHYTAHFIGNFFNPASFRSRQAAWAYHLPAILASTSTPAVQASTRAATMAFYGTIAEDTVVKTEACRWCVKGMAHQRNELEKTSSPTRARDLDIASVLAPLMFSIFETIMMTSHTGWIQHMQAAIRVLEILGPEACQEGFAHSLFKAVRLSSVYCADYWKSPPAIESKDWCTIPFLIRGKTAHDLVDDISMQVPCCLILRHRYGEAISSGRIKDAEKIAPDLEAAGQNMLNELNTWWEQHIHEIDEDPSNIGTILPSRSRTGTPNANATRNFIIRYSYNSTAHASTIARFNALCLIALGAMRQLSSMTEYGDEITTHGDSILAAVQYHERAGAAHTGAISMLHPMIMAFHQAVSRKQRMALRNALRVWGKPRGVGKFVSAVPEA